MPELTEHELSVQALINDLNHVVVNVEPTDWAETAQAVREHHTPPISPTLLPADAVTAQREAHSIVGEMAKLGDNVPLLRADAIRRQVGELSTEFEASVCSKNGTSRPIFDLGDAKRVTSPTFVPAEPRSRRSTTLSGLFSRRA